MVICSSNQLIWYFWWKKLEVAHPTLYDSITILHHVWMMFQLPNWIIVNARNSFEIYLTEEQKSINWAQQKLNWDEPQSFSKGKLILLISRHRNLNSRERTSTEAASRGGGERLRIDARRKKAEHHSRGNWKKVFSMHFSDWDLDVVATREEHWNSRKAFLLFSL